LLYCIADLHLSEKSGKPMDVFGSRWTGHREKLIERWQEAVTDDDTVVIPGDISWGLTIDEALPDLMLISGLPGKKILMKGNHDYWWQSLSKIRRALEECGADSVSLLQNGAVTVGNYVICGCRGWYSDSQKAPKNADFNKVCLREAMRAELSISAGEKAAEGKEILFFCHFPVIFGDFVNRPLLEVIEKHGIKKVYYGHIHGVYNIPQTVSRNGISYTLVSADYLNFRPLRIETDI
jgi:predicted phosphohydrolase